MRVCKKCGASKPESEFHAHSDGIVRHTCRRCHNLQMQDLALVRRFGITRASYDKLLAEQGGVCAICGGLNPNGTKLAVDHCHTTGRVRGLLCSACNAGIGLLRDNINLLAAAISYLRRT